MKNASHIMSLPMQKAIRFSVKTHEIYQKQKRVGKDTPYIMHPMTVGLILARIGCDEELVMAGILHDTIEDSVSEKKVSYEMLLERFGKRVADLVLSVSEIDKKMSWTERKAKVIADVSHFSDDKVLLKSADVIANGSELIEDHIALGDEIFSRFHATKSETLNNFQNLIAALLRKYPKSLLAGDLKALSDHLAKL